MTKKQLQAQRSINRPIFRMFTPHREISATTVSRRQKSEIGIRAAILFVFCVFLLFPGLAIGKAMPAQSQCIECHTNLKKLIRLCWEVEKSRPKQGPSAETSGEG